MMRMMIRRGWESEVGDRRFGNKQEWKHSGSSHGHSVSSPHSVITTPGPASVFTTTLSKSEIFFLDHPSPHSSDGHLSTYHRHRHPCYHRGFFTFIFTLAASYRTMGLVAFHFPHAYSEYRAIRLHTLYNTSNLGLCLSAMLLLRGSDGCLSRLQAHAGDIWGMR